MNDLVPALPWLLPYFAVLRLIPRKPDLAQAPVAHGRLVSVIIPARNEAATIETVLTSLLASRYTPLEVLVVDDRSSDSTAPIVERFARQDHRVALVQGAELPEGWYGKPWACFQGYQRGRGELLLFTDADTCHEPELLGHAVGALEQERAGLLSVITGQRCVTFWERVIMPQIWILLALRYYPRRVNAARKPRDVIANGQFILVERSAYERVGTHSVVRGQIAEDLSLAQAFLRGGEKLYLAHAERMIVTRMYSGWRTIVEGWSKNLYLGGLASLPDEPVLRAVMPMVLLGLLSFWLLPVAGLVLAASGLASTLFASAVAATIASALFWVAMTRAMGIPLWYGLLYPVGSLAALYIAVRSIWRGSRSVEWKGRIYSGLVGGRS
jgi:chlorobactene glucosyltransferase